MVSIEVTDWAATLAAFIRAGVLVEEQRDDAKAIEAAIAALCRRGYSAIKADEIAAPVSCCLSECVR